MNKFHDGSRWIYHETSESNESIKKKQNNNKIFKEIILDFFNIRRAISGHFDRQIPNSIISRDKYPT